MRALVVVSELEGLLSERIDIERMLDVVPAGWTIERYRDILHDTAARDVVTELCGGGYDGLILIGESSGFFHRTRSGRAFTRRLAEAGMCARRRIIVGLRTHVIEPHRGDKEESTKKATALLQNAILQMRMVKDVDLAAIVPNRTVAVLGTSLASMLTAERLVQNGLSVVLLDGAHERAEPLAKGTHAVLLASDRFEHVQCMAIRSVYGRAGRYHLEVETKTDGCRNFVVGGIALSGSRPKEEINDLREHFKVEITPDGRFRPLDEVQNPVATYDDGVVLVDTGDEANDTERFLRSEAAALHLIYLLSQKELFQKVYVSAVAESECGGCGICVKTCVFNATVVDSTTRVAMLEGERCRGCGNCVTACPSGARDLPLFSTEFYLRAIEQTATIDVSRPKILGFYCEGCGQPAFDDAANKGLQYHPGLLPIAVPCAARIDTQFILYAFKHGFDAVMVFECEEHRCRHDVGNLDCDRRVNLFRSVLRSRGIDSSLLRVVPVSYFRGERIAESVAEMVDQIVDTSIDEEGTVAA